MVPPLGQAEVEGKPRVWPAVAVISDAWSRQQVRLTRCQERRCRPNLCGGFRGHWVDPRTGHLFPLRTPDPVLKTWSTPSSPVPFGPWPMVRRGGDSSGMMHWPSRTRT